MDEAELLGANAAGIRTRIARIWIRRYAGSSKLAMFCRFDNVRGVSQWSFITNHARVLLLLAGEPDARLRDLAAALNMTERTAYGIVTDLVEAGYLIKQRAGRRNRYQIQEHLPLPDLIGHERTIGEVLELLAGRHVSSGEANAPGPIEVGWSP